MAIFSCITYSSSIYCLGCGAPEILFKFNCYFLYILYFANDDLTNTKAYIAARPHTIAANSMAMMAAAMTATMLNLQQFTRLSKNVSNTPSFICITYSMCYMCYTHFT